MRLRFWLAMLDLAHCHLRASRSIYLWIVGRASDATDWGECNKREEGDPF